MVTPASVADSDARLNVITHGTGVPVVAIHGWSIDHRVMVGMVEPVFAQRLGYRRIYLDLPGMGASPAPETVASTDDVLDVVIATIKREVGDEPFLIVGQSYGGYLARAVTRVMGAQVLGLALICPIGTAVMAVDRRLPPKLVVLDDPTIFDGVPPAVAGSFREIAVVQTAEGLAGYAADIIPAVAVADPVAMARIIERWNLEVSPEDGPAVPAPTLIVAGRQDHWVGYADQYALLDHYPRATFAVLDAAGHNITLEQAQLVEQLLVNWVDRVAAQRR